MFNEPTRARGSIALTPSGLQLEVKGNTPFVRGVEISLREEDGKVHVFVRHDPKSKYNFGTRRQGYATVKIPRNKYYFIVRNWGKIGFEGIWDISNGSDRLSFVLDTTNLPPVARNNVSRRATAGDRSLIVKARDCLNKYVEKGYISVRLVDGEVAVDFTTTS